MKDYIITKGGSMCFYGEWLGRPYDEFHKILESYYENDCLSIYFSDSKMLKIFNPQGITNNEKNFIVRKASEVIWQNNIFGIGGINFEKKIYPKENIAVKCVNII